MEEELQNLIVKVCAGFPTYNVSLTNIFDLRRFSKMVYFAWKHDLGFHPDMFVEALKSTECFKNLTDEDIEDKACYLCSQADFAKSIFHAAFDLESLSV